MTKIATKEYCNSLDSSNSGAFLGDLISCPTYKEIIGTDKFNVSGTYENNQLVKESDITKYTGKTKNYSYIWGEWDLTTKTGQTEENNKYLNLRIRQNFLKAPDTNLKITVSLRLTYRNNPNSGTFAPLNKTLTVNFTQTTGNDKKYAYTQDFTVTFGNSPSAQLGTVFITNVLIEPTGGTSQYEYVTNIKDITQNFFVKTFSATSTGFLINSYNDNTINKIITNKCEILPKFDIPTGTNINNIDIYMSENNFSEGSSVGVTYNPTYNYATYTFNAIDDYGKRGYKLPYFYSKFIFEQRTTNYKSYAYAIWDPTSTQTGIELTSLILEE